MLFRSGLVQVEMIPAIMGSRSVRRENEPLDAIVFTIFWIGFGSRSMLSGFVAIMDT